MKRYDLSTFESDLPNLAAMRAAIYQSQQRFIVHGQRILYNGFNSPLFACDDSDILARIVEVA
jgi:hypothetical protein